MSRAGRWIAGLAVSLVAHVGAGAALWAAIRPDPVTEQPSPETRLDMQAMQLDRSEAPARQPKPQTAEEAEADGTALAPGAIPQSRARPAEPTTDLTAPAAAPAQIAPPLAAQPDALPSLSPAAPGLSAVSPPSARVEAQAARPEAARPATAKAQSAVLAPLDAANLRPASAAPIAVSAAAPAQEPAAPAPLPSALLTAQTASPAPLTTIALRPEAAQPSAQPAVALPTATPAPEPASAARPDVRPAPPGQAQTQTAAAAPAQGTRLKAALAFPGGAGDVDPVSFAAFQSFMQPGDTAAENLRDGLAGLLAQVPCSRLQVAFDPDTVTLTVQGHVPEDGLRAPVLDALRAQMGTDIAVAGDILILPRPQCGALTGIADVGLPQSTDQITNPLLVGADTHTRVLDYVGGDRLWFDISAPDYAAYLYVDYFDAGGDVIHLSPNEYAELARADAKSAARVGVRDAGDTGLQITVGPPYGQEIAVAFAASAPLYDGLRPLVEPAEPYLAWLKTRVAEARANEPGFKGEWVYFFVTTAAQ